MYYKVVKTGEAKPLADFYHGECFLSVNLEALGMTAEEAETRDFSDDDFSLMMVVGIPDDAFVDHQKPQNIVFAIDLDEAMLCAYVDDNIAVPVQAEVITDDYEVVEE